MIGKERKKIDKKKSKENKRLFKPADLVIPIASLIVLVLLTFFFYMPLIEEAQKMKTEIKEIKEKQSNVRNLISKLDKVDKNQMVSDRYTLNRLIPSQLEVADFAYYVDKSALEHDLELDSLQASNSTVQNESMTEDVYTVSGPLKYKGDYRDIVEFLNELQTTSPYLIIVSNIKLEATSNEDVFVNDWELNVNVKGFYMKEGENDIPIKSKLHAPFSPYNAEEDTLERIRKKVENFED